MDGKQKRLIEAWISQAEQATDPYFRFMSLWIAFNASCYALFHESANQLRADLKKLEGESPLDCPVQAHVVRTDNRILVQADVLRMDVKVVEVYTENLVFSQFAKTMKGRYRLALERDAPFSNAVDRFREAIRKNNGYYVLNLSKSDDGISEVAVWDARKVEESTNMLRSFHERNNLALLKDVLYQVRCNVFHGEKVPGTTNDDRIVIAALPVLRRLPEFCLSDQGWPGSGRQSLETTIP